MLDPPPMWRMAKPFTGLANLKSCIQAVSRIFPDLVAVDDFRMNPMRSRVILLTSTTLKGMCPLPKEYDFIVEPCGTTLYTS